MDDFVTRDGLPPAVMAAIFGSLDAAVAVCEMLCDAAGNPVDYRFVYTSRHFAETSGLVDADGRTARDLVPTLERTWVDTYAKVALGGRETLRFEAKAAGLGRWFEVFATPTEPHGRFAILFRDISREKENERQAAEALQRSEKLLEELNHRVMNSLSIIGAIITLEARGRSPGQGQAALQRIGDRVKAVAQLYRSLNAADSVHTLRAKHYLTAICTGLSRSIGSIGVRVETEIEDLLLPTRYAAPLGLIVNELVTNSLKYAFGDGRAGTVRVVFGREGGSYELVVADDGRGLAASEAAMAAAPAEGTGIGHRLVAAFADQLEGMVTTTSDAGGTRIEVRFP